MEEKNKKKKHNHMKLPNGFGSIVYLGPNRRNPWGMRKAAEYDSEGNEIRPFIGAKKTYNEAYQGLLDYYNTPYDLNNKKITVQEVYELLKPKIKKTIGTDGMSESNYKNLINAYENYLSQIKDEKVIEVRKKQIQKIIDSSNLKHTGRGYIKNIWRRIVEYSNDELELNINSEIYDLDIGSKEESEKHYPFSKEEIKLIFTNSRTDETAELIKVFLYTTCRPNELLNIKNENVFLDKNYMIGGSKTKAGKNRIIPIHSTVKYIIEKYYNPDNKYLFTTDKRITYDIYKNKFDKLMERLNLNHTPYDTRHTFATECSNVGISDSTIKRLMGHSLSNDVTNNVYIHKSTDFLCQEVEKVTYD